MTNPGSPKPPLEVLTGDCSGKLLLSNLYTAEQQEIVGADILYSFLEKLKGLLHSGSFVKLPARSYAEEAVFSFPDLFQLQGPKVRAPSTYMINVQTLTAMHKTLSSLYSIDRGGLPPRDPIEMYNEIEYLLSINSEQSIGRKDRLFWVAEKTGLLEEHANTLLSDDFAHSEKKSDSLEFVLKHLGLPVIGNTYYIISEIEVESFTDSSDPINLKRPTVFDGIDSPYFKQHSRTPPGEKLPWNTTADLSGFDCSPPSLVDGAQEAISRPPVISRIRNVKLAVTLSKTHKPSEDTFYNCLSDYLKTAGYDWDRISHFFREKFDGKHNE